MPADVRPRLGPNLTDLNGLGLGIRARRRALGVSTQAAAECAGMSRSTWLRIERGAPSVAKRAYVKALEVLVAQPPEATLPEVGVAGRADRILLVDYPELNRLAWQARGLSALTAVEALNLYERHWRYLDWDALTAKERDLIETLRREAGGGRLLV